MVGYSPLDIQARPQRFSTSVMPWLLFVVCLVLYLRLSDARHRVNFEDRVVPSSTQLIQGVRSSVLQPAEEDESLPDGASTWQKISHSMLWKDTASSGQLFFISLALLVPGILLGLHMGLFPHVESFFLRFVLFFDKIVALSLLPILFIAFGIGMWSKVMLIVIGVAPTLILDTYQMTKALPREQIVKAFTLGATNIDVAYRVVLKQLLPQITNSLRLNLKPMMLFLFAGEMIAATDGLAYRIAIMRRHMGMDIIIPYLLWVALLLFLFDSFLRVMNRRLHPWF